MVICEQSKLEIEAKMLSKEASLLACQYVSNQPSADSTCLWGPPRPLLRPIRPSLPQTGDRPPKGTRHLLDVLSELSTLLEGLHVFQGLQLCPLGLREPTPVEAPESWLTGKATEKPDITDHGETTKLKQTQQIDAN